MTIYKKKFLTSSLLVVTAVGIVFSQPTSINDPTEVNAALLTFTIGPNNFGSLTNSSSESLGSITVSGVQIDLGVKYATKTAAAGSNPATLNLSADLGVLYNINPLPGTINSITINSDTGQSNTLYVGNTTRIINNVPSDITARNALGFTTTSSKVQTFDSSSFVTLGQYSDLQYFSFLGSGGTTSQIQSISFQMTVAAVVANNGQTYTFAIDFLAATENKQGLCTEAGLGWTSLKTQYDALTTDQKNAFQNDTTDPEIVAARTRYLYLRTITPSLTAFY